MTNEPEEGDDFAELSDEEVLELARELTEVYPEVMSKVWGRDIFGELEEDGRREFETEFPKRIAAVLMDFRDALAKESEEEQTVAMFDAFDELIEEAMMEPGEREEFESGLEFLIEQLRVTIEGSWQGIEELGYIKYFKLIDRFAVEILEVGRYGDVKEFFDGLEPDSQQILLQRTMSPVLIEYYEYIGQHQEITDADEARKYADMYYELAELVGKVLPRFMAIAQIVSGQEERYDELKQMGLNDLLQKLRSKKYGRFNDLAEGIDRKLRNSIAHREFKVDPIEEKIEFYDRGESVAEFTYREFQEEVFHLLALFNSLWVFRLLLNYHRIENLPEVISTMRD